MNYTEMAEKIRDEKREELSSFDGGEVSADMLRKDYALREATQLQYEIDRKRVSWTARNEGKIGHGP